MNDVDKTLVSVGELDRRTYRKSTPGKIERRAAEVRAMYYERGMTQIEIANAIDVTQRALCLFMARHGMKARRQIKRDQRGEKNDNWKGLSISYCHAHVRVNSVRGRPKYCEHCGTRDESSHYDWANLTRRYGDPDDYIRLCKACHQSFDKEAARVYGPRGDSRR